MKPLKILLLEDSADDAWLIQRKLLKSGFEFESRMCDDRSGFEEGLAVFKPNVILCDHSVPGFSFSEAVALYKKYERDTGVLIPFVIVSGNVTEDFGVECIKAGIHDYVLKDRLKRLPFSIQNALEKCRIENERLEYMRQVISKQALMSEAEQLANFGSWQANLKTGVHIWSDAIYSLYGFVPGEIEPGYKNFINLVHPADRMALKRSIARSLTSGDGGDYEFRIIDKRGSVKHISCAMKVERDIAGRPSRFVGFNLDITQRKESEAALERQEREYASLFEENPDAIISLDLNGRFKNVNNAMAALAGYSRQQLMEMDFRYIIHADDSKIVAGNFASSLERDPRRYEARLIRADGSILNLDMTNIPIVVNSEVIGVHLVAKDITEKKKLANLLDEVYRQSRIGAWELDLSKQKLSWTAVTKELHEVEPDFEPSLETAINFYKEGESRDAIMKAVERGMAGGVPWDLEMEIITAKGNERWVRAVGAGEMVDGKCVRLFGTFQDIHERKSSEVILHEAYAEKARILESIGDAFFAVDENWIVTYWNKHAEKLLRTRRDKIIGKNIWDVYPDAVPLSFYGKYQKAMRDKVTTHFEEYYAPLKLWCHVSAYPSASGLSVYFRDVTRQKKSMEELAEQNERLKEIAWIQSHDLRAPIARMLGLIHIIDEGMDMKGELPGLLARIKNSAYELDNVVRKIVRKTEVTNGMGPANGRNPFDRKLRAAT